MKKLSILIFLWILAVGIVANANIKTSEEKISQTIHTKIQRTLPVRASASDPKTFGFLLGVGIVGIVTFSRRN